jgi:D,D-heptose 1,7-bisphosphate phosphatase
MYSMRKKVCFLDRDGVINIDKGHITSKKQIFIYPDIFKILRYLIKNKYLIVVITNQSVIGRGLINPIELDQIHNHLNNVLKKRNCKIDFFIYCPHHPNHGQGKYKINCNCRKPKHGMIEKFKSSQNIDFDKSFMIGDKLSDYIASKKAKIKFLFRPKILSVPKIKKLLINNA